MARGLFVAFGIGLALLLTLPSEANAQQSLLVEIEVPEQFKQVLGDNHLQCEVREAGANTLRLIPAHPTGTQPNGRNLKAGKIKNRIIRYRQKFKEANKKKRAALRLVLRFWKYLLKQEKACSLREYKTFPVPTATVSAVPTVNASPTPSPSVSSSASSSPSAYPSPSATPEFTGPINPDNVVTIQTATQSVQPVLAVSFGRYFIEGEITDYPKIFVGPNEEPVDTQAKVQTRWPDGSVQHAILYITIPTPSPSTNIQLRFGNQNEPNDQGGLTREQMLNPEWDFELALGFLGSSLELASARQMLAAGQYEVWTSGSVATSIILKDHSSARKYDIGGGDSDRPLSPTFYATFWAATGQVQFAISGDIANTEAIEDLTGRLLMSKGLDDPEVFYNQPHTLWALTGFIKRGWIGADPPAIGIDHNPAYLIKSRIIPNHNPNFRYAPGVLEDKCIRWKNEDKNLYTAGNLAPNMGQGGARPEIGILPDQALEAIFGRGDSCALERFLGTADRTMYWPQHLREGQDNRSFNRLQTVSAIGRVVSYWARPTLTLGPENWAVHQPDRAYVVSADRLRISGSFSSSNPFKPDAAHQPDFVSTAYLLTGDPSYLRELWYQAGWNALASNAYTGRGLEGVGGILGGDLQERGQAWALNKLAGAALLSPDGSPMKEYFAIHLNQTIAGWEAYRGIPSRYQAGSLLQQTYDWAVARRAPSATGAWYRGEVPRVDYVVDKDRVSEVTLPWQDGYLLHALARANDLGFDFRDLHRDFSKYHSDMVNNLEHLMAVYYLPSVAKATGDWYQSWAEIRTGFVPSVLADPAKIFRDQSLSDHDGYAIIALGAAATYANQGQQQANAFDFLTQNVVTHNPDVGADNPKWIVFPSGQN